MKEFLQRAAACIMLAVYSLSVVPASELALAHQAERKTLNAYLERAEIQTDKERFEKIAQDGLGAAIAEWERNSLELKLSDYDEWLLQKDALEEDLQNQKELSFAAWTQKRQKEQKAQIQKTALYEKLKTAALEFSFKKAGSEPTRIVGKEFIQEAKAQWSAIAQEILQDHIAEFGAEFSELAKSEFLAMENSITNSLVNELLYDHASLKKMSDAQAASVIAQQLADDVDEQTGASMSALFNAMQTELQGADQDVASSAKEKEWLEKFEMELQAGLAKWDEAERSFLAARVEWEQNAENIFLNDNQKWMEAYNELESRKTEWAQKIEKQIQDGKAQWQAKLANLENEINTYFEEFQYKLALELQQKEQLVQAEISTYKQGREILVMAQTGIENWYARWAEKYRGVYSYWKTESDFGSIKNLNAESIQNLKKQIQDWKKTYIRTAQSLLEQYYQKVSQEKNQTPYTNKSTDARLEAINAIYNEIATCIYNANKVSEKSSLEEIAELCKTLSAQKTNIKLYYEDFYKNTDKAVWECFDFDAQTVFALKELEEWIGIFERYSAETKKSLSNLYQITGGAIEDSGYDEIENENTKLLALESYWQSKESVALAVRDYAENYSSALESSEATKARLEGAQENYRLLKEEYQKKTEQLSLLQESIAQAQSNYLDAIDAEDKALREIESQRQIYNQLYEKWSAYNSINTTEIFNAYATEINSLELNASDFETLLFEYCQSVQKKENEELTQKTNGIKEIFQKGSEGSKAEHLSESKTATDLGLDAMPEEQFSQSQDAELCERILSTSQISSLEKTLQNVLDGEETDFSALEGVWNEIEALDKGNCDALKSELEKFRGGQFNAAKVARGYILEIKASCKNELEKREAILVLIDGSLEEIQAFFADGKYNDVFNTYKDFSSVLLNQKQEKAKSAVLETLQNHPRKNIEDFFTALENASDGLGKGAHAIIELYKEALKNSADTSISSKERALIEKINDTFKNQNLAIRGREFHLGTYEHAFENELFNTLVYKTQENAAPKTENANAAFALLDTTQIRAEIFSLLDQEFKNQKLIQEESAKINDALLEQEQNINRAQNEYNKKTEMLRGTSNGKSALSLYIAACEKYNSALEESDLLYEQMENARRELRVAEEIYFYAENEYLHGNYDLETPLIEAQKNLSDVRAALEALAEAKAERDKNASGFENCKELNEYKESAKQYYKSRILCYEYNKELSEQKERLYQAQAAEEAALNNLVCDFCVGNEEFTLPVLASDFISAKRELQSDGSFSYKFELNKIAEMDSISAEDKAASDEVLKEFYSDFCVVQKDAYENEKAMTLAKLRAAEFLESLKDKKYSLEDLALAFLYIKSQGSQKKKDLWFKPDEDPALPQNYPIGDIPEKMHSVDIWEAYEEGRKEVLLNAYNKVIKNGGEQDIVNYILYSETNINPSLELYKRQHNELSIRAFDYVMERIDSRIFTLNALAATEMILITMYTVITCLPFGIGSWAAGLLMAATLTFGALCGAAGKLEEVNADVQEIQRGYIEDSKDKQRIQEKSVDSLKAAIKTRKAEEERLNILLYGTSSAENAQRKELTWNDFQSAVKGLCKNNIVDYSYFEDMHSTEGKNLKDFFYEVTKNEKMYSASEVINKMNSVLKNNYDEKTSALNDYAQIQIEKHEDAVNEFHFVFETASEENADSYKEKLRQSALCAWGKDSFNKKEFSLELISFYAKEILPALPVRLGGATEDYICEIFEEIKGLYLPQLEEEIDAEQSIKEHYFAIVENDLHLQYGSWLEKINSAARTGIEEWQRADENLNAAYNSWQKEWICEYGQKTNEWEDNYAQFLNEKQDWINQSYLHAGVQDPKIKSYAAASKMTTATKMNGTISEYISSLYDTDKFSRLSNLTDNLISFADGEDFNLKKFTFDRADTSIIKDYDEVCKKQYEIESEMTKAAAKCQAELLRIQTEEEIKKTFERILSQNVQTENWELELVRKAGYRVDSEIHRNAVVDSTAFTTIREKQTVHRYEFFKTQAPEISFAVLDYQGTSEFFIMKKIEESQARIKDWQEQIFGKTDENGNAKTKGRLQEHIGQAPQFVAPPDLTKSKQENLKDPGSGQMGMILADYQWNSLKNSQGYAELSKAIYDQKLTTGDSWFKLPTIREIAGMVCDIFANSGMAWAKYIDDIVFGALDVGMGYKSFEEVANSAIKQVLISAASSGISAAGSSIFANVGGKGAQLITAAQKAAVGLTNNIASSYINAFDFTTGTMNWEQANSIWTSASTFTSIAGSILTGALGEINNVDGNNLRLSTALFGGDIERLNSTIGSLGAAAMNYAFTGDISLNLASFNGVGLFEVGFKNGKFGAGISEGGTSFSLVNAYAYKTEDGFKTGFADSAITSMIKGAKLANKVSEMKNGDEISKTTLNTANQISYIAGKEGLDLAKDLFNGNKTLYFDDKLGGNGEKSLINMSDENAIGLSSSLATGKKEEQALIDGLIAMNLIQNRPEQDTKESEERRTEKMKTVDKLTDISAAYSLATKMLKTGYSDNENALRLKAYAESFDAKGKEGVASVYTYELATAEAKEKQKAEEKARKEAEAKAAAQALEMERRKAEFEAQNRIVKTEQEIMEEARKGNASRANAAVAARESGKTEQEVMEIARKDIAKRANEAESNTTNNEGTVELGSVKDVDWGQNYGDYNKNALLGDGLSQEAYNDLAKQNAAERYAEKEFANPQNTLSKAELKQKALNDNSLFDGKYELQDYDSSIAAVGCTLTTVTYILFCATDILITPDEANEILKNNNIYNDSNDYQNGGNNGINEKNLLNTDSYALAINTIAKIKDANITEDIIKFESSTTETKKMFDKIIAASNSDDIYYTHMRIKNENHSVLFRSMEYTNPNDPGNAQINVLNPWKDTGTNFSKRISGSSFKLKQINRADFFKLTAAGKEVYNKAHAS